MYQDHGIFRNSLKRKCRFFQTSIIIILFTVMIKFGTISSPFSTQMCYEKLKLLPFENGWGIDAAVSRWHCVR